MKSPELDTRNSKLETQSDVFDKMASGWYGFRHHTIFRKELEDVATSWQRGKLLNAGCGHGADFLPFKKSFELYGLDFSPEMLRFARKYARKFEFEPYLVLSDMKELPFADESFDRAIAVASYHHIKGYENRLAAVRELKRVLKPGGEAFITFWNHYQLRFWFHRSDTMVSWRTQDGIIYRYYHLFSYREAEKLIKQAGLELMRSFPESSYRFSLKYFSRNICLLVRK